VDNFINYIVNHPLALIACAALALLIIYFIIKKVLKLALIFGLILIALGGYFYYKAPEEFPETVETKVHEVRNHTGNIIETGRHVLEKGKTIARDLLDKAEETDQ
jgi:hypothetical protein